MKAFLLMTGNGPLAILTSHRSIQDPPLLDKLAVKGIEKFIAFELPYSLASQRYGGHFWLVANDLRQSDDLRVLDYNGERVLRLFRFDEMGEPCMHEPGMGKLEAA